MTERVYRWKKRDDWSGDLELEELMAAARTRIISGDGPFSLLQDGDEIAQNKTRRELLSRFRSAISNREVGSTFRIRRGDGDVVFTARAAEAMDEADSTNGNEKADAFWNWVRSEYRLWSPRYAGAYVCKFVSGTTQRSQHAYGNACDVFFDTLEHQHAVYGAIKNGKCPVPIDLVICERHDWSPDAGETPYGGDFHAHLHAQFRPEQFGDCGVKG